MKILPELMKHAGYNTRGSLFIYLFTLLLFLETRMVGVGGTSYQERITARVQMEKHQGRDGYQTVRHIFHLRHRQVLVSTSENCPSVTL